MHARLASSKIADQLEDQSICGYLFRKSSAFVKSNFSIFQQTLVNSKSPGQKGFTSRWFVNNL